MGFPELAFYNLVVPGGPKKNVPNFAQAFSRSLSRYEGDILQVYWASNLEHVCWILSLSVNISWRYYLLVSKHMKEKNIFARFYNFVSNFNGVPSKLQNRNLHKLFSNT